MLEGLVTWVLNNYLGKYVQLNTVQLSIALLSGKVELENVPLKTDALSQLGLPIQIRSGFIGKVKLQIPVRQIRSAPWVISLEQLYVVASPLNLDKWDQECEQTLIHDLKIGELNDLETKWRMKKDLKDPNYYASSYFSWYNYGTGFATEILENLQLQIRDVHIRYEDSQSVPGQSVALGVAIDSLAAQSCDSDWTPGFVQCSQGMHSFKLVELDEFAIYWTTFEATDSFVRLNVAELAEAMSTAKTKRTVRQYIVPSVSAQAHLKRNRTTEPLRSSSIPRFVCDLILEDVSLVLVDWQYNQIVTCTKHLESVSKYRSYRRYKPGGCVKDDPKAWWRYAISSFYPGGQPAICRPRPTWESCFEKAKQSIKYVKLYKKLLATPTMSLTADEKTLKDAVEWDLEFEELKALRELAMDSVVLPTENAPQNPSSGRSMLESWFPQWMGWYSSPSSEASPLADQTESHELEGELLQALADTVENNTLFKRDVLFGQLTFCLKNGTLSLCTVDREIEETASMVELEFRNLALTISSRPRTSSHVVELSLDALYLKDKITKDSMFPVLVGPPGHDRTSIPRHKPPMVPSPRTMSSSKLEDAEKQLFYLVYEKKPPHSGCDYRLNVRTKCLDVVYQPNAVKWLTNFLCSPYQRDITQARIEAMKSRTKKELFKNWENILEGRRAARNTWELELNITAPQIIFVEDFTNQNSAMAVIDFGRFHLRNNVSSVEPPAKAEFITKESEDDETFVTPCSTPPVSEDSGDSPDQTLEQTSQIEDIPELKLDETNFHNRLYDCYTLELSDMQILIGKAKENWRYALNKGSSTLHVVDRFNISLQIERRVIFTSDPLYPSLTLNANLPKLIVHLNENKIRSARNLVQLIISNGLPSPFASEEATEGDTVDGPEDNDDTSSLNTSIEISRLVMMQFTIDQMSLELQSRGRSVAELQVASVKVAFTKRAVDTSITLTVHSLLLVDALQTFGPDFELLVASHKHVGMDSMSGSIRDSEPTSPTSPGSPDPNAVRQGATSPVALTQALSNLSTDPPNWPGALRNGVFMDTEALITIEICLVSGADPMQIANVQFNNLDIIANQETIVELVGFARRVFPKAQKPSGLNLATVVPSSARESTESLLEDTEPSASSTLTGTTEVTFDFHRLNVLLLRGVLRDGTLHGKKICTATMTEAKIHATVAGTLEVEGSLGGLQVLDLTPEGHMHQRIISVGQDPMAEVPHPLYVMMGTQGEDSKAFSFKVTRLLNNDSAGKDVANVNVRMASLWYTHSPMFVVELRSCATEFKQYLSNLAKSIRVAATDMALGLVHARTEALAQSLNMNKRFSGSIYGSALSFAESQSPGKRSRRRSGSNEASAFASARDTTMPQTPYSPGEDARFIIDLNLDIELDSPVLVLPRSNASPEVFVAHLGKIRISNSAASSSNSESRSSPTEFRYFDYYEYRKEHYDIEVRDMNIFSLNTKSRRVPGPYVARPEVLYSCKSRAKPILHDTLLQLNVLREIRMNDDPKEDEDDCYERFLLDDEDLLPTYRKPREKMQISGSIVTALKVSLTRAQYEQLLDTVQWLTSSPTLHESYNILGHPSRPQAVLTDISEEDTGVTTLNMDPHVRAKLFAPQVAATRDECSRSDQVKLALKLDFEVPIFTIELRGEGPNGAEQGLVDLSLRDFAFVYEKAHRYETNVQVSLRSIFMEDLLQPEGSRQRSMVISSSGAAAPPNNASVSRSCPDVSFRRDNTSTSSHGSLPDHLEAADVFGVGHIGHFMTNGHRLEKPSISPCTPPPSPSLARVRPVKNLVLISTLIVDPSAPDFETNYRSTERSTSVDFNCLDLMVSVPSWVVVIDFFSGGSTNFNNYGSNADLNGGFEERESTQTSKKAKAVTNITVCSLTLVLVKPDQDLARANISNVDLTVKTHDSYKEVNGKLGSMSLLDLTLHGQIYKERFLTAGSEALQFEYVRRPPTEDRDYDARLVLDMASVMYVHTKRFLAEIQAFFQKFVERQEAVMKGLQAAASAKLASTNEPMRLSLVLKAEQPIILLPVSSKSCNLVVIDLGRLLVTNTFKYSGDAGTISALSDPATSKRCLLEVTSIELVNMDLYTGAKDSDFSAPTAASSSSSSSSAASSIKDSFKFGSSFIMRKGPSLLTKKLGLRLQHERNLHKHLCHVVPDSTIYGHLSTLDCALDLNQYKLIRGLLAYNLGEDTERISPTVSGRNGRSESEREDEWIVSSIKLDMQNVSLRLVQSHAHHSPLTCIDFIKSHLTVESFSNLSQDIDLVSQEIRIIDTRFHGSETQSCNNNNVFTSILQPLKDTVSDSVQAEIHSRKRENHTKVTILLNDMRLMAIFEWWEAVRAYIFQEIDNVQASPERQPSGKGSPSVPDVQFELKLNVTDSELIFVADSSQWDSNAVIFKSTTVVKYRPNHHEKPLSCNLNNCEMFSCILGKENETALSIIDPITLNIDLVKEGLLEVQLQCLAVWLSYHDMCMFRQMLESLPKQLWSSKDESLDQQHKHRIHTLTNLGFEYDDCVRALEICENRLDDAAIWLTQNVQEIAAIKRKNPLDVHSLEVKASCISICIIDDCGDSDVPLLDLSFSNLELRRTFQRIDANRASTSTAYLHCSLAGNYYNRILSGWEPVVEPWVCKILWENVPSHNLLKNRLLVRVVSEETFNINITSTLLNLYQQVKENWMSDFFGKSSSVASFKRRSPFVPFALKNDTGSVLKFTTQTSELNGTDKSDVARNEMNWSVVEPGETVPFAFATRGKLRHQNSHKLKVNQLRVKVDGWQSVNPVTVDKVGIYFRDTPADCQNRHVEIPPARVVFDITLEGSARKLITIRSGLMILNNLPHSIEVKLESKLPHDNVTPWVPSTTFTVDPKSNLAVPLMHTHSQIHIRPSGLAYPYTYSSSALSWDQMLNNADRMFLMGTCHSHKGHNYRFCAEILKETLVIERTAWIEQPAHRIIFYPTVKLSNLLPVDMQYIVSNERGIVKAGQSASLTEVNPEEPVEVEIRIENFKTCTNIYVPSGSSDFSCRIRLEDAKQRKLYVMAEVLVNRNAKLKISIYATHWLMNKTGLPLVFKQSGSSAEFAGQFEEHEQARMMSPLLFSFSSDQDAGNAVNARVGKRVVWDGTPQWCSNFHARKGTQYRKLYVTMREGKPDRVFIVGIEVRQGRGKYRGTHIVSIFPRYQLHNRSSYKLLFAQSYLAKETSEHQKHQKLFLRALPNSSMPFHWSNLDTDQLLCVSIEDIADCCWSGGFKIDTNSSMHLTIRDSNSRVYFLRLEVVLQSATFYAIFTDADRMPPPIRVDNFSEVAIKFGQTCYIDVMHSTARAHSSVPYAWDEPTKAPYIKLVAPGGVSRVCDMNNLGSVAELTYENFIYVAFVGTFKNVGKVKETPDVESQELVLDVGPKNRVFLAKKIPGQRSQLWRLTLEGHLEHEGSSPPSHPNAPRSQKNILVLDIADTAPQPNYPSRLSLRRLDPRRQSTQRWRFTEDGRLCCAHYNMCVQPEGGFYCLREGSSAVLGLPLPVCHKLTDKGVPIEQAVEFQRLRPGSGSLSVDINMDGPTQVITIKDVQEKQTYAHPDDREWRTISQRPKLSLHNDESPTLCDNNELQFNLDLHGVGVSVVCRKEPEELFYALFTKIIAETVITSDSKQFCVSVRDIQIDNQLLDATVPVVLYVTPSRANEETDYMPAIDLKSEVQPQVNENAVIFKHLILRLKRITAIIEEKLLLKVLDFIGFHSKKEEIVGDENDYETQRLLTEVSAASAKRYYFGVLKLIPNEIRLSVKTSGKLSKQLQRIRKKLGLTLIKFEDAAIFLEPFDRKHPFETSQFLINCILKHFKDELMWQAGVILGSVDFIGNPLGLMNDVSAGITGFCREKSVGVLVKNVTHGLSNSAAKVTESLSDGLGRIAMDDYHEEIRQKIRQVETGRSADHILAGVKSLGFGLLGGAFSIFQQVYEGASTDGVSGVFSGFGKGVVGTVTKPVVGVLDLASETARALRDSSRSKLIPERQRLPRCVHGPGSLLPKYDAKLSQGQLYLYMVNDKHYEEKLLAFEILGSASEDIYCIISDRMIRIVTVLKSTELMPIFECPLSDLETCNVVKERDSGGEKFYLEVVMRYAGPNAVLVDADPLKKPRVRCKNVELALSTARQIHYAKTLYVEQLYTITTDENVVITED